MYICILFFLDIDECVFDLCLNFGICIDGINFFLCFCDVDYYGF